jgi:uncharacterized protein (TIGR01777 family)
MKVVISGSSGYIGSYLSDYIIDKGFMVILVFHSDFENDDLLCSKLEGSDIVINLAGKNINSLWSEKGKDEILQSRLSTTYKLLDVIEKLNVKPKMFINSSAIGIYKENLVHNELSTDYSDLFLGEVCRKWESTFLSKVSDIQKVIIRTGIVVDSGSKFLKSILFAYPIFLPIVFSKATINYISLNDYCRVIYHIITNTNKSMVVNMVNNNPLKMSDLYNEIRKNKLFPIKIALPNFLMSMLLGEKFAMLNQTTEVYSNYLKEIDFKFEDDNIKKLLNRILKSR